MKLRPGEELVKRRSGGRKRVRVVRLQEGGAVLESVGTKPRHGDVRSWVVPLDAEGLPEGYNRAPTAPG